MSVRRFKRYPAYKDSGVEWLGEIPAGWDVKRLRYCCHVTEGQVAPDTDSFRGTILIAPNHIESGTGRILYTETSDQQGAISGKYVVKPGDLIYSKIRPALNKVCLAAGEWLCSADMYPIVVTDERLRAPYLLYFMLADPFVRFMIDESMRVAMPKVNRETLSACPLLLPSSEEQQAILAFLDLETKRIDALITKKERLRELLQERRAALVARIVMQGLGPTITMQDSGVEWLGNLPAHWEAKPNGVLFTERDERGREDLPILEVSIAHGVRVREFSDSRIEQRSDDLQAYKVARAGDIAFNKMRMWQGAVGVAPTDGLVSPDYIVAQPREGILSEYYASVFRTRHCMAEVYRRSHGIVDDRSGRRRGPETACSTSFASSSTRSKKRTTKAGRPGSAS